MRDATAGPVRRSFLPRWVSLCLLILPVAAFAAPTPVHLGGS